MKILIVKISALGDVIHSLPVASLLKDTIPDLNLHYVVGELSKDLLINNPIIDKVFILPKSKNSNFLNSFINIIKAVRREKYDAVIDLQGLLKSGLITGLTKAPIRIGFSKAREGANLFYNYRLDTGDYFDINQPIINQNLKLGKFLIKLLNLALPDNPQIKFSFPIPDTINKEKIENLIKYHHNISSPNQDSALNESAQALIVFITKTTWVTKNYPESSFIQLINELAKKLSAKIILIGSSADAQTNQNIINGLDSKDNIYDLTNQTDLIDLIYLFNIASLVIGGDTGPMHLASAIEKANIIAIYGASPKIRNGPYGKLAKIISLNLNCQPCFKTKCPIKTLACLKDLHPQLILEQIQAIYKF